MSSLRNKLHSLKSRLLYPGSFAKFGRCGRNLWFGRRGVFVRPEGIQFGDNVFINEGFHISARDLEFGSDIMIGPHLVIECDDHVIDRVGVTMFENRGERSEAPVRIENDVWMGAGVTILKGVTIGEGCVVGANSVVTRSLPPYSVCVGAPCRPRRGRFGPEQLKQHLSEVNSAYQAAEVLDGWNESGIDPAAGPRN
ncbi:MAG: acyltransferase [Verrucomicrobiota bacterium]